MNSTLKLNVKFIMFLAGVWLILLFVVYDVSALTTMQSENYAIEFDLKSNAGEYSESENYNLNPSLGIGETGVINKSSENYSLYEGYFNMLEEAAGHPIEGGGEVEEEVPEEIPEEKIIREMPLDKFNWLLILLMAVCAFAFFVSYAILRKKRKEGKKVFENTSEMQKP